MEKQDTKTEPLLSYAEAASHIGVIAEQTLRNWFAQGNPQGVPSLKIGRRRFFRRSELEAWLRTRREG